MYGNMNARNQLVLVHILTVCRWIPKRSPAWCAITKTTIELYPSTLASSSSIRCNYVDKPTTASFDYIVVNGEALYNSTNSVDFELHESEETELVLKILALAGVSIEDPQLYQIASSEEVKKLQQEKV